MGRSKLDGEQGDQTPAFGPKIRRARKRVGLTLTELAAQCDISPSFISQIERDLARPSVATLHRLAVALGLPMSEMLGTTPAGPITEAPTSPPARRGTSARLHFGATHESYQHATIVRANRRPVMLYPGTQIRNEILTPDLNHALQMMWVVIPPSEGTGDEGLVHEGEECGVVIQGRVGVWAGPPDAEEYYELGPGDAIYQDSTIPHRSRNIGEEPVFIVTAMTPPSL